MKTVYRYKVKPLPFLALALLFSCASTVGPSELRDLAYDSIRYWLIFAGLVALVWAWYASRWIVVSDQGIDVRVLFGLPYSSAPWGAMEEWTTFEPPAPRSRRMQPAVPPTPFFRWLWGMSGTGIRVIARGIEPLEFFPNDLSRGWDIEQALKDRGVPFRR